MRVFSIFVIVMSMMLMASCRTASESTDFLTRFDSEESALEAKKRDEAREQEAIVRKRLDEIQKTIEEGSLNEAASMLEPLRKVESCQAEVAALFKTIDILSRKNARTVHEKHLEVQMVDEAKSRLAIPEKYGTTVVIDPKLDPVEMPTGSQEDLINRKISLSLENANVAQLVDELNAHGLNVIADDALQADKTVTVKVTDVPIKEIFSYVARNMGIAFYIGENMVWVTQGEDVTGPKLETRIFRLPHGFIPDVPAGGGGAGAAGGGTPGGANEDNDLEDVLTSFLQDSPDGSNYQIFRNRNLLVVRNTRENLRLVEKFIKEFDRPPLQVSIEARFITISEDDLKEVGVELNQRQFQNSTDGTTGVNPETDILNYASRFGTTAVKALSSATQFGAIETESGLGTLTVSGVVGDRIFTAMLQAIEKKKSSISLNVPRVTVMNNRTARIRKGDKLYYFEEYDTATVNKGDARGDVETLVPTGSPTELPIGLTFDVRVNVGNDMKTVLLGLNPEIVDFIQWENYNYVNNDDDDDDDGNTMAQIKLPRTHEQQISTTVEVKSGETVVLGGLLEHKKSREVRKIPLLGDIPFLGFLFRRTSESDEPTNLLIFVTARVINERGEYVQADEPAENKPQASSK